jgi:hypothetical protein
MTSKRIIINDVTYTGVPSSNFKLAVLNYNRTDLQPWHKLLAIRPSYTGIKEGYTAQKRSEKSQGAR